MSAFERRFRCAIASLVCICVMACGGGGGGGGSAGESPSTQGTGLVPPAPNLGAVLAIDATGLRPMSSGASYVYRGVERGYSASGNRSYFSTLTQATNGSSTIETSSNAFQEGADSIPVSFIDGGVVSRQMVDLDGSGNPSPMDLIELRSPVRAMDQYVLFDRRLEGVVADLDGDQKAEALDIAAYRRVMGAEEVALPNLPALTAIRVDETTLARVRLTVDGSVGPTVQVVVSRWYAPGIGVVRQQLGSPVPGSSDTRRVVDEQLVAWDGVTTGLGFTAPELAVAPMNAAQSAGVPIAGVAAAVRVGDGAVALLSADTGVAGWGLARLDARGRVTLTRRFSEWSNALAHLASVGREAVVVQSSNSEVNGYRLVTFDDSLQPRTPLEGVALDLGASSPGLSSFVVGAAGDGTRLWILYRRIQELPAGKVVQLLLRAFETDGRPATPEYALDAFSEATLSTSAELSAGSGRAMVTWVSRRLDGGTDERFTVADGTAQPVIKVLTDRLAGVYPSIAPVATGANGSLLWSGLLETPDSSALEQSKLRGVALDALHEPIRTTTQGGVDSETISGSWAATSAGCCLLGSSSRQLVLVTGAYDYRWEGDQSAANLLQLVVVDHGSTSLAQRASGAKRYRFPFEFEVGSPARVLSPIVLEDRVILLAIVMNGRLATSVLWLR